MTRTHRAAFIAVVLATLLALSAPAAAHDPIFLTDEQSTPETGPYFPDGSISWAIYGSVLDDGDTRGFEFDLRDGDELYISLLIPNLDPELGLSVDELPTMDIIFPDGSVQTVEPVPGEIFDEPFSGTSYVTLYEDRQPAQAGRHQVVVNGHAPSRFSVAVGETEEFGTPAERTIDRPDGFLEFGAPLNAWWTTPPGADAPVDTGEEELTIDVEGAEEALAEIAAAEEAEAAAATGEDSGDATPQGDAPVAAGEPAEEVIETEVAGAVEVAEDDAAEDAANDDAAEVAAAPIDSEGGGSPTWVIPVVLLVLVGGFVGGRVMFGKS